MEVVLVTAMAAGGRGVARLSDGCVLFVPGGFPGDRIRPRKIERKKRFSVALEWELEVASADREPAVCPVATKCGGCDWMGLKSSAQRKWKRKIVEDSLRRVGKLTPEVLPVISEGQPFRYRSRARLHVSERGTLGFRRSQSHEIVTFEDCAVCTEPVNRGLRDLQAASAKLLDGWSTAEVRAFDNETASVHLVSSKGCTARSDALEAQLRSAYQVSTNQSSDYPRAQLPALENTPGSVKPWASPADFTQVNWPINRALVQTLIRGVEKYGLKSFLDLYCGVGNFSFPLLERGLIGLGLEVNVSAVASARHTAAAYGLKNGTFKASSVADELRRLAKQRQPFDLVILDPPRTGAKEAVVDVAQLAPRYIFYVACDPVTFARDLAGFAEHGYLAAQVQPYDMFPQTHHVETSAWLTRSSASH